MKSSIILSFFWVMVFLHFLPACTRNELTVKVDSKNPHYFNYRGKPILLVTCDHTYFGVTAPDFDYVKFLDKLAANGNNFTRIYPGAYPANYFNQQRIFPWAKDTSGKYNLDVWDPAYFKRLHGFMQYARSKGIIVDICLFNGFGSDAKMTYQQRWNWCALKDSNNIQAGVGTKRDYFCTLEEPALVNYEKAYVRKIVSELNQYDNLIYDISDEPDFFNTIDDSKVNPWISEIMDEVINTEASLPKKHILAETYHSSLEDNGKQWGADPRTSWISVEYDKGLNAFGTLYAYNKPCVLIETTTPVFNPSGGFWGFGYGVDASRVHSWAYIIAGGAGFMEFNDDYDSQAPGGRSATDTILQQRKILKDFMYSFDFTKMYNFTDFTGINKNAIRYDTTAQAWGTAIAETGKQYALYVSHSYATIYPKGPGYYVVVPGIYNELITLKNIPNNTYKVEWVNPSSSALIQTSTIIHPGGDFPLQTPNYNVDIVLRMKAITGVKQAK